MIKTKKLTLEQRIVRLERLLQCDNKSCNKNRAFEAREALDNDDFKSFIIGTSITIVIIPKY